jgi:hypothetical protein
VEARRGQGVTLSARSVSDCVDFLCFNEGCLGIGRWSVLVDADTGEPLDEQDAYCSTCDQPGEPE